MAADACGFYIYIFLKDIIDFLKLLCYDKYIISIKARGDQYDSKVLTHKRSNLRCNNTLLVLVYVACKHKSGGYG